MEEEGKGCIYSIIIRIIDITYFFKRSDTFQINAVLLIIVHFRAHHMLSFGISNLDVCEDSRM